MLNVSKLSFMLDVMLCCYMCCCLLDVAYVVCLAKCTCACYKKDGAMLCMRRRLCYAQSVLCALLCGEQRWPPLLLLLLHSHFCRIYIYMPVILAKYTVRMACLPRVWMSVMLLACPVEGAPVSTVWSVWVVAEPYAPLPADCCCLLLGCCGCSCGC